MRIKNTVEKMGKRDRNTAKNVEIKCKKSDLRHASAGQDHRALQPRIFFDIKGARGGMLSEKSGVRKLKRI